MDRHSADERLDTGSVAEEQSSAPAGITAPVSAAAVSGAATVAASSKAAAEYRQTADEHVKTLKDFWKDFLVSGIFILAAIVIIFACLAWFAANNRVSATGNGISAKGPRYTITSVVTDGQDSHAGVYDDSTTMEKESDELSFSVTNSSNLNNYTQEGLYPGASGVLSFTVTPYVDDIGDITISLFRIIQTKNSAKDTTALINLLKGHLLFFTAKKGDYYSGRVTDSITIISDNFHKDGKLAPMTVNLYWIWPEYFQNYVLTGNVGYYKNLFASVGEVDSDYNTLLDDMNGNPTSYYSGTVDGKTSVKADPEMSSSDMTVGAALFNNADEKLGNEVDYLKIKLKAQESKTQEGTTSGNSN